MNDETRAFFGQQVRKARLSIGMTQRALAAIVGTLHQPDISDIERGKTNPTLDTMRAIAYALGVLLADLLPKE